MCTRDSIREGGVGNVCREGEDVDFDAFALIKIKQYMEYYHFYRILVKRFVGPK